MLVDPPLSSSPLILYLYLFFPRWNEPQEPTRARSHPQEPRDGHSEPRLPPPAAAIGRSRGSTWCSQGGGGLRRLPPTQGMTPVGGAGSSRGGCKLWVVFSFQKVTKWQEETTECDGHRCPHSSWSGLGTPCPWLGRNGGFNCCWGLTMRIRSPSAGLRRARVWGAAAQRVMSAVNFFKKG